MKTFKNNGLSIAVFTLFVVFWVGQLLTGWRDYNNGEALEHRTQLTLSQYLFSNHCAEATFENWESEFLQMGAYVVLTSFLVQRGSAESKDPDKPGSEDPEPKETPESPGPVRRGGWLLAIYKQSLALAFFVLFLFSFAGHAVGGWLDYREELAQHGRPNFTFGEFLTSPHFWFQSFQNWQSEFLAVGFLVVLTIWLRQEGSPQSKPVTAPHSQTGE